MSTDLLPDVVLSLAPDLPAPDGSRSVPAHGTAVDAGAPES